MEIYGPPNLKSPPPHLDILRKQLPSLQGHPTLNLQLSSPQCSKPAEPLYRISLVQENLLWSILSSIEKAFPIVNMHQSLINKQLNDSVLQQPWEFGMLIRIYFSSFFEIIYHNLCHNCHCLVGSKCFKMHLHFLQHSYVSICNCEVLTGVKILVSKGILWKNFHTISKTIPCNLQANNVGKLAYPFNNC